MATGSSPGSTTAPTDDRLDSWKEIAAHLRRDVSTVQRWERREGMPVHRHIHDRLGSVYAFRAELDEWWQSRERQLAAVPRSATGGDATTDTTAGTGEAPLHEAAPGARRATRRLLARWPATALLAGIAAIAVVLVDPSWLRAIRAGVGGSTELQAARRPRVAVMAFENRSTDRALDDLRRLAANRVVGVLAELDGVDVLPDLVEAHGTAGAVDQSRADAGAALVITGSYFVRGDQLEFHARLREAPGGRLLHAIAPVSGSRSALSAAMRELEQRIAGAVAIHFDDFFGGLHVVSHPPRLDAYKEYRAGLETFSSNYTRMRTHLERALAIDPDFWLPLSILHFAYRNLGDDEQAEAALRSIEDSMQQFTPAERMWAEFLRARSDGRRTHALAVLDELERLVPERVGVNYNVVQELLALNLPGRAVAVHAKLGSSPRSLRHSIGTYRHSLHAEALHLLGEYERELTAIRQAQQDAPGVLTFVNGEVRALAALGDVDDLMRVIERSLATAPASGSAGEVIAHAARELLAHGHIEASRALADRGADWYRSRVLQPTDGAAPALGRALYLAERWTEAHQWFSALALHHRDDITANGHLGLIAARQRVVAGARAASDDLSRVPPAGRRGAQAAYYRARIAAALGEREAAIELLRDAFSRGLPYGVFIHQTEEFAPLLDHQPFVDLVRPRG